MEYIMQELYARLTTYNFTAFISKALAPNDKQDPLENSGDTESEKKSVSIAFSQAVTVCRQLLVKQTLSFIRNAIETIKGHTFAKRFDREYERKVKPQSNRPFCYKTSWTPNAIILYLRAFVNALFVMQQKWSSAPKDFLFIEYKKYPL